MNSRSAVTRETAISIAINMLFSAIFFAIIFGFNRQVRTGGANGLGEDFIPQSFMVSLMGSLVPTLITRARQRATTPTKRKLALDSAIIAAVSALIGGGGAWAMLGAIGPAELPPLQSLMVKLVFAAILSTLVTPTALRRMLRAQSTAIEQKVNPA